MTFHRFPYTPEEGTTHSRRSSRIEVTGQPGSRRGHKLPIFLRISESPPAHLRSDFSSMGLFSNLSGVGGGGWGWAGVWGGLGWGAQYKAYAGSSWHFGS